MDPLLEKFLNYLKENNASGYTLKSYKTALEKFLRFSNEKKTKDINQELVRSFKLSLRGYKKTTQNSYLIALRQFLSYQNLDLSVALDKVPKSKPELINPDLLKDLLLSPSSKKDGLRDRAILALFISTGLKVSELSSLNRGDVNLKSFRLSKRGLHLNEFSRKALETYLLSRKDNFKPLFIRFKGDANPEEDGEKMRLSERSIERVVKKYAKRVGKFSITPKLLRHNFALNELENGESLKNLQKILGYSHLSSTQVYKS